MDLSSFDNGNDPATGTQTHFEYPASPPGSYESPPLYHNLGDPSSSYSVPKRDDPPPQTVCQERSTSRSNSERSLRTVEGATSQHSGTTVPPKAQNDNGQTASSPLVLVSRNNYHKVDETPRVQRQPGRGSRREGFNQRTQYFGLLSEAVGFPITDPNTINKHTKRRRYLECLEAIIKYLQEQIRVSGGVPSVIQRRERINALEISSIRTILVLRQKELRHLAFQKIHAHWKVSELRKQSVLQLMMLPKIVDMNTSPLLEVVSTPFMSHCTLSWSVTA
ncbi:hypothetical protein C8Q76DRAFT_699032 [Earliella scabrosa]|nr:hypothetical protein C8Q76DRAFT_699032 [Earliella scabrosa]